MCGEVRREIRTDFITARADAGPHRRHDVGRFRLEALIEGANRRDDRTCRGAPPSGMHSRYCTTLPIGQQDRYAVGGPHADRH
jgi:hypothetical protein